MEQLPEEVLLHVLGFLDEAADLARACLVNHTWHILACDDAYPNTMPSTIIT